MTEVTPAYLDVLIDQFDELDLDLFMGRTTHWGGWMWDAGKRFVRVGLASQNGGSIQFDTPLAEAAKARIEYREKNYGWSYKTKPADA